MAGRNRVSTTENSRAISPAATAGRLRLVQTEFADESPELRQQLLTEEIERALSGLASNQRASFLASLQEMFPSWDARVELSEQPDTAAGPSMTDQRELRDPSFLVTRLIEVSSKLSIPERQTIIERLKEAGLARPSGDQVEWPAQPAAMLREHLKLNGGQTMNPGRVLELAALLAQLAASMDQVARLAWKEIAPSSTWRRSGDLAKTMARFAQADDRVGREQVQQELEGLRSLIAALIQAIGHSGKQLAQTFRRYTPAEIEPLARLEKKFMETNEAASWRKYKELATELNEASIEMQIRQAIAAYAESFLGHRH